MTAVMRTAPARDFRNLADAKAPWRWFHRAMSIVRLLAAGCLALLGAAVLLVASPALQAAVPAWHMPELPLGALVFALVCGLVLWRRPLSQPRPAPLPEPCEPFGD